MKITMEDYKLPYLLYKNNAFFPSFWWQEYPLFGIVRKKREYKQIAEYGIIIFGLWITIIHEWGD